VEWQPPKAARVLDFDIENRPLNYGGGDFTFSEVTAIGAAFIGGASACWLLDLSPYAIEASAVAMLKGFTAMWDTADIVVGHCIRKHDLPILNGAMTEHGLPPLSPKLAHDTYYDLKTMKGVGKSQENLAAMLGVPSPKVGMSQAAWRAANRGLAADKVQKRVMGDVIQNIEMRKALIERGMLKPPRMWRP
jgi:hypothetical protein